MQYQETLIDELISSENYTRDIEAIREHRYKAIHMAHRFHFQHNYVYHEFCQLKGIGPQVHPKNFHKLLLPDRVFKSYLMENPEQHPETFKTWLDTISSLPIDDIPEHPSSLTHLLQNFRDLGFLVGFSSGTSGKLTFLPRDDFTRAMIVQSYIASINAHVNLQKNEAQIILGIPKDTFLQVGWNGRHTAETLSPGKVLFAYEELKAEHIRLRMRGPRNLKEKLLNVVMGFLLPRKKKKAIQKTIAAMQRHSEERIIFLAPPFFLVDAARFVLQNDLEIKLHEETILASTGGFKGREVTNRKEMNHLLGKAFGIDPSHYLDLYGMTESNSIIMECPEANAKHIPPWIEPILFNDQLEPLKPEGVVRGRYGFLEPSSKSFPGFILTGDVITVNFDPDCPCGCPLPVVSNIGRAPRVEQRGCSGVLSRTVSD